MQINFILSTIFDVFCTNCGTFRIFLISYILHLFLWAVYLLHLQYEHFPSVLPVITYELCGDNRLVMHNNLRSNLIFVVCWYFDFSAARNRWKDQEGYKNDPNEELLRPQEVRRFTDSFIVDSVSSITRQYAVFGIMKSAMFNNWLFSVSSIIFRFYKNPDKMGRVLHVGTVIEGPSEYFSSRLSRKDRKQTIVEEILGDQTLKNYSKRKYMEIQFDKSNKKRMFRVKKKGGKKWATSHCW